jgi:ABC-type branched-subunit amino acid transport system ATPase component
VDGVSLQVADYVHVLSRGRIVHSSVPEALWHNQEVKARYLGM